MSKIHSQPGVRWDLFPGGEQEGRLRTVVDFFGNVQNVEIENANATDPGSLKEDLAEIARLVEKWRKRDEEYSSILGNSSQSQSQGAQSPTVHLPSKKPVGATKMAEDGSWGKRLVGLSVVGACTAVWVAGSILGRSA
jgi:glycosylphosphatidylinositol transamidase (GPIT) subunit GPI8